MSFKMKKINRKIESHKHINVVITPKSAHTRLGDHLQVNALWLVFKLLQLWQGRLHSIRYLGETKQTPVLHHFYNTRQQRKPARSGIVRSQKPRVPKASSPLQTWQSSWTGSPCGCSGFPRRSWSLRRGSPPHPGTWPSNRGSLAERLEKHISISVFF